jgi:hypothetical protein
MTMAGLLCKCMPPTIWLVKATLFSEFSVRMHDFDTAVSWNDAEDVLFFMFESVKEIWYFAINSISNIFMIQHLYSFYVLFVLNMTIFYNSLNV